MMPAMRRILESIKNNVALAQSSTRKAKHPIHSKTHIQKVSIPRRKELGLDGLEEKDQQGQIKAEVVEWRKDKKFQPYCLKRDADPEERIILYCNFCSI
jgi:hypothetical protein